MAKPTGISFINRIDSILKQQNRTRKSLCDDLEILPCTMATWTTKNILPSIDTAYKIAEHLNVSLDWLLTGKIITENSNSFTDNLNKLNEGNFALIKNLVNSLIDKQEYQQLSDSLIHTLFDLHIIGLSNHKNDYIYYSFEKIETAIKKEREAIMQFLISIKDREINEGIKISIENLNYRLKEFEKVEKLLKEEKGNKMNRRNVTAMTSNNNQEDYRCQKS